MFSKNKQPPIRSLVAHGCHVRGDLSFTDGLGIDGTVEGLIQGAPDAAAQPGKKKSRGTLVFVSEQGRVLGGIRADTVIINGMVEGPVHADRVLELQPKARVSGDVSYRQLEMHQGALISGRMLPLLPTTEAEAPKGAGAAGATTATNAAPNREGKPDNPLQSLDALLDEQSKGSGKAG